MNTDLQKTTETPMRSKPWIFVVVAYVFVMHLAIGGLVIKGDYVAKLDNKISMLSTHDRYANRMLAGKQTTALLGDSITWVLGDAPNAINYAVSGEVTQGLINTLPTLNLAVDRIFLMIGINDIWIGKQGLHGRLAEIDALLPAGVPVVWSGITPTNDFRIDPEEVQAANEEIKRLCAKRPRCSYLDTWEILAKDGKQIPEYFLADGVHLSASGYDRWIDALPPAAN
ncbi:GDSL-type esterase/lipase family protein [Variovorax sp. J31P207]|uniref:SGNH/GDSL hydrolase family protein n=1 Tax=Variovorax sp. J31P207 TaxID=3053510 RepID=UPI002575DAA2|nr:GDSL-type esterase/lipase family protein [Variovorax sp. J31P207]MDM0070644.1 GDSL-type esterase/lipase family protein [Variovorax sp. J31P207]